jgi:hypothetical protein
MARGGQGLPLETIVLAAVAILILVMIVLFATGSFAKLFGSQKTLSEQATPDQLASFRIGCEQACFQAQQLSKNADDFKRSDYCTTKKLGDLHCWSENVSVSCSKTFTASTNERVECSGTVEGCDCEVVASG